MPRGPVAGGELKNALDQLIAVPNVPGRTFGLGNGGGTVRRNWYDSTGFERASVRGALRAEDREKLCNWLGWKKQTLQRALTEGKALTSDILVLGILPINIDVLLGFLHIPAGDLQQREARSSRLAAAREDIIKSEGHVRATIAWRTVAEQCKQVANHLWQSAPLNTAARANLTQWQLAVERDIGEERYVALHPVLRAGLYELVMMLDEHVAKLSTAHAELMLLTQWSPKQLWLRIIRTRDMLAAVHHAAQLHEASPSEHARSWLETESSDAMNLLECLPLPPDHPDEDYSDAPQGPHRHRHHHFELATTGESSMTHPYSDLHALGAEPRLGRRAALYYGFHSPAQWAARRM